MQRPSDVFSIGQRLEIGFGEGPLEWLPSRFEDHLAESTLTVAWPTDRDRRLIEVEPGTNLQLVTWTHDAMYTATVVVQEASTRGVPMLTLEVHGAWQRSQRRNAVRSSIAVRPRIADVLHGERRRALRLGVTNISAGGVQVRSQDELRRGDLLDLAFELMGLDEELRLKARVCRVQRLERVWDAGCEFEDVPERLAQRIVQFIFAQQRASARAKRD
jgi:c-di-GMP-binding flagellar brake protein YcgR